MRPAHVHTHRDAFARRSMLHTHAIYVCICVPCATYLCPRDGRYTTTECEIASPVAPVSRLFCSSQVLSLIVFIAQDPSRKRIFSPTFEFTFLPKTPLLNFKRRFTTYLRYKKYELNSYIDYKAIAKIDRNVSVHCELSSTRDN